MTSSLPSLSHQRSSEGRCHRNRGDCRPDLPDNNKIAKIEFNGEDVQ
jgi:hypothetical protein